jgi:hypothetical protein
MLPTPQAHDQRGGKTPEQVEAMRQRTGAGVSNLNEVIDWGQYEPAIRRWADVFGEDAPAPTDDEGRLNPDLVRWMMGYPAGWVDGISRTAQLRCLGNAIVPLQAATAWAHLLGIGIQTAERERERERLLPTPRTSDANGAGEHGTGGPDLRTVVTQCL